MIARGDDSLTNPDGSANTTAPVINGFTSLTGIGATLYFSGIANTGAELYTINNGENTPTLTELNPGARSSSPSNFILVAGRLFATAVVGSLSRKQLVRIDSLGANPSYAIVRSSDTNSLTFSSTQKLQYTVTDDGKLYFSAESANEGSELFKLDSPGAAPSGGFLDTGAVIKDIVSDPFVGSNPTNLVHIGTTVYFFANDNRSVDDGQGNISSVGFGKELWSSNGTSASTNIVKDILGGSGSSIGDKPEMTVFGGRLYFTANDGSTGTEIWESNGLPAGTVLNEINTVPAQGANPTQFTIVGSSLFFAATDGLNGEELWSI